MYDLGGGDDYKDFVYRILFGGFLGVDLWLLIIFVILGIW